MACPKFMGRDCELSTTGIDRSGRTIPPWEVTRAVLDEVDAAFASRGWVSWNSERAPRVHVQTFPRSDPNVIDGSASSSLSSDCLRHWLPNGQCIYSDLAHVELATAETLHPLQYAAQSIGALLVAEAARKRAQALAPPGTRLSLSTSNVDPLDPRLSWGTHDNICIESRLWNDLFVEHRHPAILGFVASAMAAAIPFFGGGYLLGPSDDCTYSLSARAHHLSFVKTLTTTEAYRRGLLNERREPHGEGQDRLHLIGFDYTLVCAALKCCFLQCCLAAAEEGLCEPSLYDPVSALRTWSWNLDLSSGQLPATAHLTDGRRLTLPVYMRELTTRFLKLCEAKVISRDTAPDAPRLLSRILDLTHYLERGEMGSAARGLDWAAKLLTLLDLCERDGATLGTAATRLADHDFASTQSDAPFWRLWEDGVTDPIVSRDAVEATLTDGPAESRAWARGRIVRRFRSAITDVDWSYIELLEKRSAWRARWRVELPHLDSLKRSRFEPILRRVRSVTELCAALHAELSDRDFRDADRATEGACRVVSVGDGAAHDDPKAGENFERRQPDLDPVG